VSLIPAIPATSASRKDGVLQPINQHSLALRYEPAGSLTAQVYSGFSACISAWYLGAFLYQRGEEPYFHGRSRYDLYAGQRAAYYQAVSIHKHRYLYIDVLNLGTTIPTGRGSYSFRNTLESVVLYRNVPG
jgi:hypothetical protein